MRNRVIRLYAQNMYNGSSYIGLSYYGKYVIYIVVIVVMVNN